MILVSLPLSMLEAPPADPKNAVLKVALTRDRASAHGTT
jgi:hypothetical protein